MCVCVDLHLAEAIRANSPTKRVMGLLVGTRPVTAGGATVRTSTDRSRHKAALSTRHHRDLPPAMAEARVVRPLVGSSTLVMEDSGMVRDIVEPPMIGAKPHAEARQPVTTTSAVRLVRHILELRSDGCI